VAPHAGGTDRRGGVHRAVDPDDGGDDAAGYRADRAALRPDDPGASRRGIGGVRFRVPARLERCGTARLARGPGRHTDDDNRAARRDGGGDLRRVRGISAHVVEAALLDPLPIPAVAAADVRILAWTA